MTDQDDYIPPRHGEDEQWLDEPQPVCPVCGGLARRTLSSVPDEPPGPWTCDLHGEIVPEWVEPLNDEEEDRE